MPSDPDTFAQARAAWAFRGQRRPAFAHVPGPGQESIWDYPRPPRYVPDRRRIEIHAGSRCLAHSEISIRVLETGSPPTFYLPPAAFEVALLRSSPRRTHCEWKGAARYWHVQTPDGLIPDAVWSYPEAAGDAAPIAGWYAAYPDRLRCFVAGEAVRPQAGGYYGGWITAELAGPFKGEPGTRHW